MTEQKVYEWNHDTKVEITGKTFENLQKYINFKLAQPEAQEAMLLTHLMEDLQKVFQENVEIGNFKERVESEQMEKQKLEEVITEI